MNAFRDRIVDFRRVKASELIANPKNWRKHPKKQAEALKAVLTEIGFADAVLVRQTDAGLELIDGHLRAEIEPNQELPCLVLDVDESEAEKLLATLDPLAAMATADAGKLAELLANLRTSSPDLQAMLDGLAKSAGLEGYGAAGLVEGLCDPDEIPAPPDEPTTQRGDLWLLGDHRLLCGDSSLAEDVDRLLDGAPIHLVNTDPPYNVRVEPRSNNAIAAGLSSFSNDAAAKKLRARQGNAAFDVARGKAKTASNHDSHRRFDLARHPEKAKPTCRKLRAKDRPLANDFVSDAEFDRLLHAWFGHIGRVLLPGHALYCWGGYANVANYPPVLAACGLYFSQAVIWVKEHPVLTRKDRMGSRVEPVGFAWERGKVVGQ
jgi:hypothetical protein